MLLVNKQVIINQNLLYKQKQMQESQNATVIRYSESPFMIKHHIPSSFNLKMIDFQIKKTPRIILKRHEENPLTNLKLKEDQKQKQKHQQIIFKNRSHNKYNPKKNIQVQKIFKTLREAQKQGKIIKKEIQNMEQLNQQIDNLDADNQLEILNAKLTFSTQFNYQKQLLRTSKLLQNRKSMQISKKEMNLEKLKQQEKEKTRIQTSRTNYKTSSRYRSEQKQESTFYSKRKNSITVNFKRDLVLKYNIQNDSQTLKRSNTMHLYSAKTKSLLTDDSFQNKKNQETDMFKIEGRKAPRSQMAVPWQRSVSQSKKKIFVFNN